MVEAYQRFLNAARQHGVSTLEGDAKETNQAYEYIIAALRELRQTPDKGVPFLSGLLSDDDPSVATWASLFMLPFDEPKASRALERVAESGIPRFALNARMTLREWQAGRLNIE